MKAVALGAVSLFSTLLFGIFSLIAFVVVVADVAGSTFTAFTVSNPSEEALEDIPQSFFAFSLQRAQQCPDLPWTVIAGISKVESNHDRFASSTLGLDGVIRPSIIGIPLNGTNGTARFVDSDDGRWDGDTVWDRAVGPFQFIPGSWRIFGGEGNNVGLADPNNVFDAVPAMRRHLCPDDQIIDIGAAAFSYNRSQTYVDAVLDWARRYTCSLVTSAVPIAGFALAVSVALVTESSLGRPHHDYAAWDLGIPVGTPLFAMTSGTVATASSAGIFPDDPNRCGTTVTIAGIDGAAYTYCLLSQLAVVTSQVVGASTPIGLSGEQPGAPGAGYTTGPHLHLGIRFGGATACPQPLLFAIYRARPINPATTRRSGACKAVVRRTGATGSTRSRQTINQHKETQMRSEPTSARVDEPPTQLQSKNLRLMYTVTEAAGILGIGRSTAYELILRGELDAVRVGRRWLVRPSTLALLLGQSPPRPGELA